MVPPHHLLPSVCSSTNSALGAGRKTRSKRRADASPCAAPDGDGGDGGDRSNSTTIIVSFFPLSSSLAVFFDKLGFCVQAGRAQGSGAPTPPPAPPPAATVATAVTPRFAHGALSVTLMHLRPKHTTLHNSRLDRFAPEGKRPAVGTAAPDADGSTIRANRVRALRRCAVALAVETNGAPCLSSRSLAQPSRAVPTATSAPAKAVLALAAVSATAARPSGRSPQPAQPRQVRSDDSCAARRT